MKGRSSSTILKKLQLLEVQHPEKCIICLLKNSIHTLSVGQISWTWLFLSETQLHTCVYMPFMLEKGTSMNIPSF